MPEPSHLKLTIRVADLPQIRLLVVELTALLETMAPGPQRDRLERALQRLAAIEAD